MLLAEHGLDLSGVRHLSFLRVSRRRFRSLLSGLHLHSQAYHGTDPLQLARVSYTSCPLLSSLFPSKLWGVGQSIVQEC